MSLFTYCNMSKPPLGNLKWGAANESSSGGYGYSKSAEQFLWSPSVNIEEGREVANIETHCSETASYDADPRKWRKCIDGEMSARLKIREMLDGKPVDDGRNLLSNCFGYITGLRSLGSMEYVSKVPLPACLKVKDPDLLFNDCVRRVTGKARHDSSIYWDREQAHDIADCFNRSAATAL